MAISFTGLTAADALSNPLAIAAVWSDTGSTSPEFPAAASPREVLMDREIRCPVAGDNQLRAHASNVLGKEEKPELVVSARHVPVTALLSLAAGFT
ncbi:MAG: hypothetical protein OXC93_06865 [Rhodospirillaceae bacterium]|nr:hypothetical protein [Rhodospirillaceae bacterium]